MRRQLSSSERFFSLVKQASKVNFAVTARISGSIAEHQLRAALAGLKARHPLIAMRIGEYTFSGGWLVSEGVADFSIRVVETEDEQAWVGVVEEELQHPFSFETGPLVRFALVRAATRTDLVVVCQHAIADGLSGAYLLRDILQQLGAPSEPSTAGRCAVIEDLLPPKRPSLAPNGAGKTPRPARPLGPPPSPDAGTLDMQTWFLDQERTAALCERCRAEQTTVHAALSAAFMRAFVDLDGETTLRRVETPVNLRPRLVDDVRDEVGLYVTILETSVECAGGNTFWEVARAFRQQLRLQIEAEEYFAGMRIFRRINKIMPNALLRRVNPPLRIGYDISITNLGALNIPLEYGPLRLEAIYGPSLSVAALNHRVLGVATLGGRIFFSLNSLDRALALQLKEHAMRHLLAAI